jgi:hypothetical protein
MLKHDLRSIQQRARSIFRGKSPSQVEVDNLISSLHAAHASDVSFSEFRYELIRNCRDYLRKNRP